MLYARGRFLSRFGISVSQISTFVKKLTGPCQIMVHWSIVSPVVPFFFPRIDLLYDVSIGTQVLNFYGGTK